MTVTRHLVLRGRVQGVGFRQAMQREALARGCTGWVRNRRDGSVEAVVQGAPEAVESLVAWARRGPPAARVDELRESAAEGEAAREYASFDWLPTA
ncbi:MAG: acylphosphatase [Burkholderiales bacterium]|nr:acylphosphatase [Burkholderiales bacterium]